MRDGGPPKRRPRPAWRALLHGMLCGLAVGLPIYLLGGCAHKPRSVTYHIPPDLKKIEFQVGWDRRCKCEFRDQGCSVDLGDGHCLICVGVAGSRRTDQHEFAHCFGANEESAQEIEDHLFGEER